MRPGITRPALLLLTAACCSCVPVRYVPRPAEAAESLPERIRRTVSEATGVPPYTGSMESGQRFLLLCLPGLPFDETELSFASVPGRELTGDPVQLDRAYRFYRLVDDLLPLTRATVPAFSPEENVSGLSLGRYYRTLWEQASTPEERGLEPRSWTDPTYDERFWFTTVSPASSAGNSRYRAAETLADSVRIGRTARPLCRPLWHTDLNLVRYRVDRPWFDPAAFRRWAGAEGRWAVAEEVVLLKRGKVCGWLSPAPVRVRPGEASAAGEKLAPDVVWQSDGLLLLAFVYRIL